MDGIKEIPNDISTNAVNLIKTREFNKNVTQMKANEAKKNNVQQMTTQSNHDKGHVYTKQSSKFIDLENKDAHLLTNITETNVNIDNDNNLDNNNKKYNDLTIINETSFINNIDEDNDKFSTNRSKKLKAIDEKQELDELKADYKKIETTKNINRKSEINFDFTVENNKKMESNKNLNVHFKKITDKFEVENKKPKKKTHINKSKSMIVINKDKVDDGSNLKSIKTFKVFHNDIFDDTNESKNMSNKETVKVVERRLSKKMTYKGGKFL